MNTPPLDGHFQNYFDVRLANTPEAGCIRLVLPPAAEPDFLLPMERFCGHSLTDPVWHPARLPRTSIAEISRLAVHTQFRWRLGESESLVGISTIGDFSLSERRTFPLLSLALFYAGAADGVSINLLNPEAIALLLPG